MRYCLGPPEAYAPIWAALAFMPFGLFFDFMDGKVARWRKKSSLMGQELDSLADLVRQERIPSSTPRCCGSKVEANSIAHYSDTCISGLLFIKKFPYDPLTRQEDGLPERK